MQKQTNKQKKKSSPKFKIMLKFNARRHGVQVVRQHGQSIIGKHLHVHALGLFINTKRNKLVICNGIYFKISNV
jgi:hypothetical protein